MKKNSKKKKRIPLGLTLFTATFVLSIVAIQAQRVRYIGYLHEQGVSAFSFFVPVAVWLPFHYSVLTITLDMISLLPFVLLATGWIGKLNRTNR
jgi:hypothetical protein